MTKVYAGIVGVIFLMFSTAATLNMKPKDDFIKSIIESIPNPLELTTLIKQTGTEYVKSELANPASSNKYTDSYERALNLGVYGTDLGFASIYNKNQDVLDYLSAIKELANGLNIGQFFDAATLKELTSNSDNLEELIRSSTRNLQEINEQLQTEKREHLSVLFVTGGWIESTHLLADMHKKTKNEKMKERLAEQKLVLDRLLMALDAHKTQPKFNTLIAQLKEVQKVYRNVKEETVEGKKETIITEDGPEVRDTGGTTYTMTDKHAAEIGALINGIRSGFVK